MRILLIGEARPHNLEFFYQKAFRQLGHEVTFIDQTDGVSDSLFFRVLMTRTSLFRRYLKTLKVNTTLDFRVDRIGPDLIVIFKGHFLDSEVIRSITQSYKTVLVYPDSSRFKPILRNRVKYFNTVFTQDNNKKHFMKLGAKRVVTLPFACDPDFHKNLAVEKKYPISFIGTFYPNRYFKLRRIQHHIDVFGNWWIIKVGQTHPAVYGFDYVRAINESAINVNVHHGTDLTADAPNMRTFEVTGCGGFICTEYMPSMSSYFTSDEVQTYRSGRELAEVIECYLDDPGSIVEVGLKAQQKCYARHTYLKRAQSLISSLS